MRRNFPTSRVIRRARRGIALIMVLSVVAATSILAWAMLSASSIRSQIDSNAVDAVEATSLAESGASYAMHCLHFPDQFRPNGADAATWFYPGQTGLQLWSDARGTVDITVTSTGTDTRQIVSTSTVTRPGATSGSKHTVQANVTNLYQGVINAAGFNGNFTLPAAMHIYGTVVAKGTVSNSTNVYNSPALVPTGTTVVPAAADVRLLNETGVASTLTGAGMNDRTYTYNGNTYIAEKAPTTITAVGLNTTRTALNPCNVWYSDANVLLNGANFTGVLVLRGTATLNVAGTNTLHNPTGMAALVVGGDINYKSTAIIPAKLTATGAVWLGGKVSATAPDSSSAVLKIDGALLAANAAPQFNLTAAIDVTYNASVVGNVTNIPMIKTISGLKINKWSSVD